MPNQIAMGALMMCKFGAAPATFVVLPANRVRCEGPPAANIMDHKPMINIMPFGLCSSTSNPEVIHATALALGALTPMPCVPVTTPWTPGVATVLIGKIPALDNTSTCLCAWGGEISFNMAGTVKTMIA